MKRDKNFRIQQRERAIKRKLSIIHHVFGVYDMWNKVEQPSRLDKNKVHCSCPMCATKTKKDGRKHSEKKKLNSV